MTSLSADNPFVRLAEREWHLPDIAAITPAHYEEGFAVGMAEQSRLLRELAANADAPTPENVLGAWEDARRLFAQVKQIFWAVKAADSTPELDDLAARMAAPFAAHNDAIYLDADLYARLRALRQRAEAGEIVLDEQDDWALGELERSFVSSGVLLDEEGKTRLRDLNARLAELSTTFERNNRDARNAGGITLASGERVDLVNTSQQPRLATLADRDERRRLYEASVTRANGGEFDNRQVIVDIARARAERANLLGYPHHAALVAEQGTAKTAANVADLLVPIARAALAAATTEADELTARLRQDAPDATLEPWDWSYLTNIVRAERFDFDESALAGFLDVETVLAAVFDAATMLYGIGFTPRPDVRGHTEDAEAWEVREADGTPVGLFVMDLYARPTKGGGAWMNSLVVGSDRYGEVPVVTNNCNYSHDTKVISWSGVITMFHEFGHALHGLFAANRYPSRSGTAVPRDFVEFPSQVNEWWAWQPGRVLPAEWLDKLGAAERFGSGFATLETLMAALLDQSWHRSSLEQLPTTADEVDAFEARAIASWGLDNPWIPPRYRSTYFSHIWGGGYASGYYGYTWSEVMDADAVAWFEASGGGTRANGDHFRTTLLAPGGSVDPAETYRRFRGRDPEVGPLLDRLGFPDDASS